MKFFTLSFLILFNINLSQRLTTSKSVSSVVFTHGFIMLSHIFITLCITCRYLFWYSVLKPNKIYSYKIQPKSPMSDAWGSFINDTLNRLTDKPLFRFVACFARGLRALVSTGSRSTAFKGTFSWGFFPGGFYLVTHFHRFTNNNYDRNL